MRPHRWLFALTLTLGLGAAARDQVDDWVDRTVVPPLRVETSVEVLDRSGTLLRAYTVADGRWRLALGLGGVDPAFTRALIAYEDKRFYRHGGIDPRAMLRASWQALRSGRVISGGSTLTMQVARLLEDGPTGQWQGKLRQVRLALALERRLTKDQILTLYLNRAPYGGNIEGLRAATRAWFGKEPRRLTQAQIALLVALPQAPEARRPDRFPEAAESARRRVLERLAQSGALSAEALGDARLEALPKARRAFPAHAPHLADRLRRADPLAPVIDTTLEADLQARLERLARDQALQGADQLSVALIIADHQTGEVLAHIGSAGYQPGGRQGFVDITRALRSPGSTLKPLVYGLAFDAGLAHPETLIEDRPRAFSGYAPVNFDGQFRGTLRVREALQLSLNLPVVTLTDALGPPLLMTHLRRAGARPAVQGTPGLAISLGGLGLTLEDLTRLYAALANQGRAVPLHMQPGTAQAPLQQVLSPEAAWQITHILAGLAPPPGASNGPMAYKTGTSYGHRDTWAVGYDARHVVAVWMGRADGTPVPGAFGGSTAAPLLFAAFDALKPQRAAFAPPPPGVLLAPNAALPQPLQRFASRTAVFDAPPDAPRLAFPPDGATLDMTGLSQLTVRVRGGTPPFTWLANGAPVLRKSPRREAALPAPGKGTLALSVIDAKGQSARIRVTLE